VGWTLGARIAEKTGIVLNLITAASDAIAYHIEITPWYLHGAHFQDDVGLFVAPKGLVNIAATRTFTSTRVFVASDVNELKAHVGDTVIFNAGPTQVNTSWYDVVSSVFNYYRYCSDAGISIGQSMADGFISLLRIAAADPAPSEAQEDDLGTRAVKKQLREFLDVAQPITNQVFTIARGLGNLAYSLMNSATNAAIRALMDWFLESVGDPNDLVGGFEERFYGILTERVNELVSKFPNKVLGPATSLFSLNSIHRR